MNKVIVTGGAGFIGSNLVRRLIADGVDEVLIIDDIKDKFTNIDGEPSSTLDFVKIDNNISCKDLSIIVSNSTRDQLQSVQLVLLNNGTTAVLLQKDDLDTTTGLSTFSGISDIGYFDLIQTEFDESFLRFVPHDADIDYDLKTIEIDFTGNSGIGTQSVGFTSLTSSIGISTVDSDLGITTTTIIGVDSNKYESFYAKTQLINKTTNEMNYVEHYVTHDSTDTYLTESFIDTHSRVDTYSGQLMGTFKGDLTDTQFSLLFENTSNDEIKVNSNIVGFGTTTAGTGVYRFAAANQPAGSERSLIYASNYNTGIGTTVVYSGGKNLFNTFMSVVEVSVGSTKALHQVTSLHDGTNVYVQQSPFLSVASTTAYDSAQGIGTFGGVYSGDNFILKFYPDASMTSEIKISSFKSLYLFKFFKHPALPKVLFSSIITTLLFLSLLLNFVILLLDNKKILLNNLSFSSCLSIMDLLFIFKKGFGIIFEIFLVLVPFPPIKIATSIK